MKITFEESLSTKEWIHKELMTSLTGEVIDKAMKERAYDVKLLVNGVELEPKFFNNIVNNIEKYIEREAQSLINDRLFEAEQEARKLEEVVRSATENLREKFNIPDED